MKFWKKLAVCSTLALSCIAFNGCNCSGRTTEVSVDLDGDGIISDWETVFGATSDSLAGSGHSRVITVSNLVDIYDLNDLKSINEKTSESNYYILRRNIDCGGEELNINLGKSVLYGNDKVIKNFKLKEIGFASGEENSTHIDANVYGFIYNGVAIYDLNLFAGYQVIEIDNLNSRSYVSPLVNVSSVDGICVKGKLEVKRIKTAGLSGDNKVDISLGVANLEEIADQMEIDVYSPNISDFHTIGVIDYSEETTGSKVRIGSIVSALSTGGRIYNAYSSVNITAYNTGTLCVGGIAGENEDLITGCGYSGEIKTTYDPNTANFIGGVAGRNFENGELKNCVISGKISFDTDVVTSIKPKMTVGGAVGRNLGVVNFIENNCDIEISNAVDIEIGGICGSSEYGIFSNIINRANILLTKCQNVYIAEICGYSKYGRFEQIVDMSNIKIENAEVASNVKLGMVTIFEDFSSNASLLKYNAEYTPTFDGILMTGTSVVNQKKVSENSNNFQYNLGLRNPYEYEVIGEDGQPETTRREDSKGNPILDENDNEIYDVVTKTRLPDEYNNLYYLNNSHSIKRYTIAVDNPTPIQDNTLAPTYAKGDNNTLAIQGRTPSIALKVSFFRTLGFKYGLNHNELDFSLSAGDTEVDLNKLTFVLDKDRCLTKYFENERANCDLAFYDDFIDEELTFDSNEDTKSEFYSYLNALVLSDTTQLYTPIKFSYQFASCQDPNNTDSMVTLANNFARNVSHLLNLIFGATPNISELTSTNEEIGESTGDDVLPKYEKLEISDSKYRYAFTFQIDQMNNEDDSHRDNYIVYMKYEKTLKYPAV